MYAINTKCNIHNIYSSWCFRQGWVNKRSLYIFIWGMQFINTSSLDYLSSRNQIINNKHIKESKKRRLYANKCESQVAHVAQANGCQLTYNWQIGVCAPYTPCTKACTNHSGVEGGIRRKAGSMLAPLVDANVSIALLCPTYSSWPFILLTYCLQFSYLANLISCFYNFSHITISLLQF